MVLIMAATAMNSAAGIAAKDQAANVLDAYLEAFNQKDTAAWRATHHGGFFVVGPEGRIEVYEARDRIPPMFRSDEIKRVQWQRAGWETRDVVQGSENKVHVQTRLTLYREDGSRAWSQDAIYIITNTDGWAVAGVSTMPPVTYGPDGAPPPALSPDARAALEKQAMRVLDEFMEAFNAQDEEAYLDTHNFPHLRLANEEFKLTGRDSTLFGRPFFFFLLKVSTGFKWDHSGWDQRIVAQASPKKIHVLTRFSRYTEDNEKYGAYDSLYVLTREDGQWGVKGRSSFAPL